MEESISRVVLVVSRQHVKTVKSALERAAQLDRDNKIIPDLGDEDVRISASCSDGLGSYANAPDQFQSQAGTGATTSGVALAPSDLTQQQRFPRLQFDVISGEYVDPSLLDDRIQREPRPTGDLLSSLIAEVPGDPDNRISFSPLEFDVASGEYIEPSTSHPGCENSRGLDPKRLRVPTNIPYPLHIHGSNETLDAGELEHLKLMIIEDLGLDGLSKDISISYHVSKTASPLQANQQSPVHKALRRALTTFLCPSSSPHTLTVETLVTAFPNGYSVYKPMLLLPHNALSSAPWQSLISTHPVNSEAMGRVWQSMVESVGATHIAINSPIPLSTSPTSTSSPSTITTSKENILRSPANLTPLYGDFGPAPTSHTIMSPTAVDFMNTLWVTTRQNGIWQTWAPLYTMFSRGNLREKARILTLPSVKTDLDSASAAVDLYAGIGYFAFSYKKSGEELESGIKQVLCWEINPWSVEGLRRGAEMNGWTCRVFQSSEDERHHVLYPVDNSHSSHVDLLVFQTSNEGAGRDYASVPSPKLPIRHVNLGLLPSSKLSWRVAVTMLDKQRGGWIHVHENVGIKDIETKRRAVEQEFQSLVAQVDGLGTKDILVEHVEKVKMYAPGVVHCVFDVFIGGKV
jgi:tRNA wybutosine-synthesizing protein 2